jgi:hypothetical protein
MAVFAANVKLLRDFFHLARDALFFFKSFFAAGAKPECQRKQEQCG